MYNQLENTKVTEQYTRSIKGMNGSNLSENKQQKLYKYTKRFWLLVSMIGDLLQEIERGSISRLHEESLTTTTGTYMEVKSNSKWRSTHVSRSNKTIG